MGIFKHKKMTDEEVLEQMEHYFDENFREELRNRGRLHFEKIINENGLLFKQDLAATIVQVNADLKEHIKDQLDTALGQVNNELQDHITKELETQFKQYSDVMKNAQQETLSALTLSAQSLKNEHQKLVEEIQKDIQEQKNLVNGTFEDTKRQLEEMKQTQEDAVRSFNDLAQSLKAKHEELNKKLEEDIAHQKEVLVSSFNENMARIVEHHLLEALGDKYDMKAQLPSILEQLEANKQAIVDDMKL